MTLERSLALVTIRVLLEFSLQKYISISAVPIKAWAHRYELDRFVVIKKTGSMLSESVRVYGP